MLEGRDRGESFDFCEETGEREPLEFANQPIFTFQRSFLRRVNGDVNGPPNGDLCRNCAAQRDCEFS